MALALAKAGPLKPEIRLSQALVSYERVLSAEQKLAFSDRSNRNPDTNAVMVLTCEIDRQNAGRKTRRCGARLTSFLNSVKGFTSVMDLIVSGTANPIAGTVWSAVKVAIQVSVCLTASHSILERNDAGPSPLADLLMCHHLVVAKKIELS